MLKSIHRLSTKQFMEVMEKGRIYTSPLFVVRILENKEVGFRSEKMEETKRSGGISAVAPKKVAVTAVMRNKLRRQIYEAVAPLQKNLASRSLGASVIIFAKKETLTADLTSMTSDLKNLFAKARISV